MTRTDKPKAGARTEEPSSDALRVTLHQLQVHQIELETQNEELRRTQLQLDAARARYFDLYDLAPVGYCSVSEQGLILEANLAAASLLGVARKQLVGQRISRFIIRTHQDIFYLLRKQLFASGGAQNCELLMVRADGGQRWVHLCTTCVIEDSGAPVQRIVLSDITERHRLDAALQDKNLELEQARAVAEKANQAKSEFLSGMSHELRTPLSAILGFAQLIESGTPAPTPGQQRSLEQIVQAGWYLLDLINEILDLALIESGKLALQLEPVALAEVMRECQTMSEPQAQKRGITVRFPRFDLAFMVYADRTRIKQVLINLLSNAIKYNRPGGSVTVDCLVSSQGHIRLQVEDSGYGLSPEQLAQLFQPFNRLGQQTRQEEGTGIGLVMSKRLVEMMGGSIGVSSTVGKGSVFWLELKLTSNQNYGASGGMLAIAPEPVSTGTGAHTLLYVEDNAANLLLMEELIARRPDLRLLTAFDGSEGVELARTARPDLILMDCNLPVLSGIQALTILKADPVTASIPVIALSANAVPGEIEKGLQAGFFRYLTKPIRVNELMATIDLTLLTTQLAASITHREQQHD